MAKNRRNQSAAIRFGPALKAGALCLLIGGSAVGYVWQKDQIRQLGLRITEGEKKLEQLRRQNEKWRWELGALRSPANLERLAQQHALGLQQPSPNQVVRLQEPEHLEMMPPDEATTVRYAANRNPRTGRPY